MNPDPATTEEEPAPDPALLQLVTEMLGTIRRDGRVESLNPAWEAACGRPARELLGALFTELFDEGDRAQIGAALQELARGGGPVPLLVRCARREGPPSWVALRFALSRDEERVFVAGHDVTASKASEQEQEVSQNLAELGLVAGIVAHDLNNVLTIIGCCSSLLRASPGQPPAQARDLDDLDAGVRHGVELVRQVLAFAQQKPQPSSDVNLNRIIARMDWMLRRLGRKDVCVDLALGRDLGRLRASEIQMEQVLLNLVINARDALPPGGKLVIETGNVEVRTGRAAPAGLPPGDYVRLTVSDDGLGMTSDVQARLFEPFFTTKKAGNGLGLFSVMRIVRQCGGHVRLRSAVGRGSSFDVYFPRVASPAASSNL